MSAYAEHFFAFSDREEKNCDFMGKRYKFRLYASSVLACTVEPDAEDSCREKKYLQDRLRPWKKWNGAREKIF